MAGSLMSPEGFPQGLRVSLSSTASGRSKLLEKKDGNLLFIYLFIISIDR